MADQSILIPEAPRTYFAWLHKGHMGRYSCTVGKSLLKNLGSRYMFLRLTLILTLVLGPVATSLSCFAAEPSAPQYLLFQIFLGGPEPRSGIYLKNRSKADILRMARQIATAARALLDPIVPGPGCGRTARIRKRPGVGDLFKWRDHRSARRHRRLRVRAG